MQKNKLKSLIHFHFIVFIFGFTAILGSLISIDSIEIVWYRMALASIVLLIYAVAFKKQINIPKSLILKLLFSGMIIALHWVTFFKAIKVSNVSITLSVLSLGAFLTSLLEPIFYRRKIILYEIIFGLIVVIGMSLIFKSQFQYIEGILYALVSVFLSVLFGLINGKLINKASSLAISIYELLGGVLLISIILLLSDKINSDFFNLSENDFYWLLILAIVCTAYAFVVSVDVLKHLSPYSLMISINMEPVYGIILAIILLDESNDLSFNFYLGFILIFSSVILNGIFKLKNIK
ncbi:MAG: DMT family transporter [Flavobacteriales bacterium]|jgi:drug/metabolite transporter (DMT)-like permease|tara:strand:- start:2800 stop:3678 length:879 start_codon:yes stop_codon:yes gene_type:complete